MASPDRHFANAAIFTHSTGLTPNSGDAALYIKSDNKAYIKDSAGAEAAVGAINGTSGTIDNAIIRADSTGGATIQSSDLNVDDATTTTQNNVAITNQHAGQTNSSLVLTPKGTGAFILGPKPDGTSAGGNARGANAVDLQIIRSSNTRVASGANSFIAGINNTASGARASVFGNNNTASGNDSLCIGAGSNTASGNGSFCSGEQNSASSNYSVAFGQSNAASGDRSIVLGGSSSTASGTRAVACGLQTLSDRLNMFAHSSGGFAAAGDAQRARFVMRNKTTTNAAVELFLDGSATRLTIPSGKYLTGTINIAGIKSDGAAAASYIRQFSIKNVAGTTSLVGTVNTIGTDEAAGTSISITANDTNDALKVEVTGITSETWRWVASVDVVEVAYGT